MRSVLDAIVEENLNVYAASPSRLQEDVSQEAQVASDYRGRLAYELLQNADDAMESSDGEDDRVVFIITDDALWMANSGRPLSDADIRGLCGLGASSKVDAGGVKRASIGHKGLGFKSVLEMTDQPRAYSTTVSFALGKALARPHIDNLVDQGRLTNVRDVPVMRFPSALADDPPTWTRLRQEGYNTAFELRFKQGFSPAARSHLADLLTTLPTTTVLFLKHLESIDVLVQMDRRTETQSWTVSRIALTDGAGAPAEGLTASGLYRISIEADGTVENFLVAHDGKVPIGDHRGGLSGPAWQGVDISEVSIAIPDTEDPADSPVEWRRFHVFLPTEEPSPYPMLVNGAFVTDLARRSVSVTDGEDDYNSHLVRSAAALFRRQLVPRLLESGSTRLLAAIDRGFRGPEEGAAESLHQAVRDALADVPTVECDGGLIALNAAIVPPQYLGSGGEQYREALGDGASWDNHRFPVPELCAGRWARILADHGGRELEPTESIEALAALVDPNRTRAVEDQTRKFRRDPVLEIAAQIWSEAENEDQDQVADSCRSVRLFPVAVADDGTVERIPLDSDEAFFPPRAGYPNFPLGDIRFMAHPLCWGSLTPQERTDALGDDLWVWGALFDISEFRFEEVVRKAVLPALLLDPDADAAALLDALQSLDSIAAICQLAGNTPKPERPLRYERLGSDRGLFNLSRLPLPCRDNDGVSWVPAYRVYFGKDWIGDESVEDLFTAAGPLEANYLLAPSEFLGRLPGFGAEDRDDVTADDVSNVDDEVDIDEDTDRAVEGTEQERWISFLEWIGVNRAIRPIHFHDVEDRDAGWLTTKELAQPKGWAFKGLEETWGGYRRVLTEWIANTDAGDVIPYVYRAHDLDQIVPVLEAARRDATGETAKRFFTHLAQHWDLLDDFAHVELALVESRFQPSMRTRPVRAKAEELTHACEDFWLFRLRESSVCPTTHGPRAPAQTFAPSPEAQRRFGGRGRRAGDYIPLLELDDPVTTDNALPLARRLGVRTDLNPSTFTIDDAKVVCERIRLHLESQDSISESDLRERVRPVYRQVFELLSGSEADSTAPPLVSTPLLALTPNGYSFLPASEIFYSRTPGLAQRSGVLGSVPTFVIDADSSATSPLTRIFGVQQLETALQWSADPSEPPFDSDHLPEFREALRRLAPFLLARVLVERSNPQDVSRLKAFVDSVMPAEFLDVSGEIAGQTLDQADSRPYFVGSGDGEEPTTAFVQWDGPAWPPTPESAQALAMALADVLGINLVEGFLGLIRAEGDERLRLLDLAGARAYLPEAREALEDTNLGESPPTIAPGDPAITKTPAAEPSGWSTEAPPEFERPPAPPHVPLRKFSDLLIGGEPLLILGPGTGDHSPRSGQDTAKQADRGEGPSSAPGVDINALDALGMRIAIAYEVNRLSSGGLTTHAITADTDLTASSSRCLVVDVSTPDAVRHAEANPHVSRVLAELAQFGIGTTHPGFDILTIREGFYERLIELKSSAVNAQVQQMTWNEWKSAGTSRVRQHFWLYLVGNLRADLSNAPFVRAIRDPFGVLASRTVSEATTRTAVQLRVREFESAEELQLEVRGEGEVRRE